MTRLASCARSIWSTGQDQCATIKRQLSMLLPGISTFLDVDVRRSAAPRTSRHSGIVLSSALNSRADAPSTQDLESIDALEEYIDASQVIMIFVSKGYFGSKNCLREARTAVQKTKPLALVHDPVRGGATLEAIKEDECPVELQGIFNDRKVIEWHRIKVANTAASPG